MKKLILSSLLLGMLPISMMAQDDMYMIPSHPTTSVRNSSSMNQADEVTYSGSNRDVDEYNRKGQFWSHYQKIGTDQSGNDVIQFQKGRGVYPDSTYIDTTFVGKYYDTIVDDNDYRMTNRMSRWDGFYDPWFYSSYGWGSPYWSSRWGFYDPWFYGYSGWNNPWYGGYAGWYDPWYSGYYGYGYPYGYGWGYPYSYWYGGGYGWGGYPYAYSYRSGHTGTLDYYDRSNYSGGNRRYNTGVQSKGLTRGTTIYENSSSRSNNVEFGSRRSTTPTPSYGQSNSTFGNTRSYSPAPSSPSSGSFGGGFSGGSSSGGGLSGGGHLGGGRR